MVSYIARQTNRLFFFSFFNLVYVQSRYEIIVRVAQTQWRKGEGTSPIAAAVIFVLLKCWCVRVVFLDISSSSIRIINMSNIIFS